MNVIKILEHIYKHCNLEKVEKQLTKNNTNAQHTNNYKYPESKKCENMAKAPSKEQKKTKQWFIKNIILPNNEIIDKPGFILYQFEVKGKNAFMREILFPEKMLSCIETQIKEKQGEKGVSALYRAGKRWGNRFAKGALFPQKSKNDEKTIRDFLNGFAKFCESVYSTKFEIVEANLKKEQLKLKGKDVIVCSVGGVGEVFLGAWVGVWAHINEDKNIEGKQITCQGNKEKECVFYCAKKEAVLREEKIEEGKECKIEQEFYKLNTSHNPKSEFSLARFLELGNIKYEGGFFKIKEDRLVLHEASSIYFIEDELRKIKCDKIVFECAYKYFEEFAKGKTKEFLIGFLMSTGWGEVNIFKNKGKYTAQIVNFPWVSLAQKIEFQMVCGAISGFLSAVEKRKIVLKKEQISTMHDYLEITLKE